MTTVGDFTVVDTVDQYGVAVYHNTVKVISPEVLFTDPAPQVGDVVVFSLWLIDRSYPGWGESPNLGFYKDNPQPPQKAMSYGRGGSNMATANIVNLTNSGTLTNYGDWTSFPYAAETGLIEYEVGAYWVAYLFGGGSHMDWRLVATLLRPSADWVYESSQGWMNGSYRQMLTGTGEEETVDLSTYFWYDYSPNLTYDGRSANDLGKQWLVVGSFLAADLQAIGDSGRSFPVLTPTAPWTQLASVPYRDSTNHVYQTILTAFVASAPTTDTEDLGDLSATFGNGLWYGLTSSVIAVASLAPTPPAEVREVSLSRWKFKEMPYHLHRGMTKDVHE